MSTSPNKLTRFLNVAGGMSANDAEHHANLRLQGLQERADEEFVKLTDDMSAQMVLLEGTPTEAVRTDLRRLAYTLASNAGTFARPALGQAALSMCKVLDVLSERNAWDRQAIGVHVHALRLLAATSADENADYLVTQLQRVVEHVEQS